MESTDVQKPSIMNETDILKQFNKLFPSPPEMQTIEKIAQVALKSGFLSKDINSEVKAEYIILKAKELDLPPILGLTHLNVISGKVCASAELMMILIRKNCPTAIIEFHELSTERCVIHATRNMKEKKVEFKYDVEDVIRTRKVRRDENGQLIDVKESGDTWFGSWSKHPRAMLRSRCVSEMARSLFPDAIGGVSYTPEQLGAEVGEDEEILNVWKENSPEIHSQSQLPEKEKKKLILQKKEKEASDPPEVDEELIATMEEFEKVVETATDKTIEEDINRIQFEDWVKSLELKKIGQDMFCKTSAQSVSDSGKAHQLKFTEFDRPVWFPNLYLVLEPGAIWIREWFLLQKKKDFV